ncbi:carboxylesterase/lipase family protein [Tsuneonella sp. HG222]
MSTATGSVAGVLAGSGYAYKGVPYAAPPVGELRWRSPRSAPRWTGVRDADAFGPPCAQAALRGQTAISGISREDCLYLNIWTPADAEGKRLPVMVWIHGGAFANGMRSSPTYDGARFADEGVILVTLNYRLGIFGFLAHPDLTTQSDVRSSGNFGLEDQLAALRWVAANIAGFGGDPGNVTLFGQSAGGASVLDLVTSQRARGLFRRAIIQSGASLTGMTVPALESAEQQGLSLAAGQSISRLRQLSQDEVLQRAASAGSAMRLGPVRDGYVIKGIPANLVSDLQGSGVQLLVGSNSREGLAIPADDRLENEIHAAFGAAANSGLAFYRSSPADPILGTPAQQFATDSTFRCGTVDLVQRIAAAGLPVWQYQFEQFVPGREAQGAAHSFEVPYVLGNLSSTGFSAAAYEPADRKLSDLMVEYWTNFAKTGDPNGAGPPEWPRYTPAGKSYLRLSSAFPANAEPDADLRGAVCRLFPPHSSIEQ